jgi:hypothetical protein
MVYEFDINVDLLLFKLDILIYLALLREYLGGTIYLKRELIISYEYCRYTLYNYRNSLCSSVNCMPRHIS